MAEPFPLQPSLWHATAPAAPQTPPLAGDAKADVCIVGAGYAGLSTALHLAEAEGTAGERLAHNFCLCLVLGYVHDLSAACLLRLMQGGQHAEEGKERRHIVADGRSGEQRWTVRPAVAHGVAREGLAHHVVGRLVADLRNTAELLVAEAGYMHDYQPGIDAQQFRVVYAQLLQPDEVFNEDIAAANQVQKNLM